MRPAFNTAGSVPDLLRSPYFASLRFFFSFLSETVTHNFNMDNMSSEWGKKMWQITEKSNVAVIAANNGIQTNDEN